jgi:hypothetical protein
LEIEAGATDTWVDAKDLLDASKSVRYLYAIYFSVITMTTIGYGDVAPTSPPEISTLSNLIRFILIFDLST